jgi:hypothetical protein
LDSTTFDLLTRGFAAQRTRRSALGALIAGLAGIGAARGAGAQVGVELASCGNACDVDDDCNAGYRCTADNRCFARADSLTGCNKNADCPLDYEICNDNGKCINQVDCAECAINDDCPGDGRCNTEGRCIECETNNDCRDEEICRKNSCVVPECRNNDDCSRRRRCRNGRCVRRN